MGDEAFRELSRPDPTADQLLDDVSTDLVCFLRFFDAVHHDSIEEAPLDLQSY